MRATATPTNFKPSVSAAFHLTECGYRSINPSSITISTKNIKQTLNESICKGKLGYEMTKVISLPPFLTNPDEIYCYRYPDAEPNYITSGKVISDSYCLENTLQNDNILGKIVLIPSADPGYDWIFSHGIKGFITMYGGANSHMAIRAGELGIPAVVGVGEKLFNACQKAKTIEIDAGSKIIRILK